MNVMRRGGRRTLERKDQEEEAARAQWRWHGSAVIDAHQWHERCSLGQASSADPLRSPRPSLHLKTGAGLKTARPRRCRGGMLGCAALSAA
jgi:hypothetical protein